MTISFSSHWASFRKPWHIFLASIMPCRAITMAPNFPLAQERWVNERHPLTLSNQNIFSGEFCVYVRTSILTSKLPPFHTLSSWLFLQFIKLSCVCSWMKAHKIHPIEREWIAERISLRNGRLWGNEEEFFQFIRRRFQWGDRSDAIFQGKRYGCLCNGWKEEWNVCSFSLL